MNTTDRYRTIVAAWEAYAGDRERSTDEDFRGAMAAIVAVLPEATPMEVPAALRWRSHEAEKEAVFWNEVMRLAQATGCLKSKPVLPWLVKRGLIRRDGITAPMDYAFTDKANVRYVATDGRA